MKASRAKLKLQHTYKQTCLSQNHSVILVSQISDQPTITGHKNSSLFTVLRNEQRKSQSEVRLSWNQPCHPILAWLLKQP